MCRVMLILESKMDDQSVNKTTTVSVGGNVGGHVVMGDKNQTGVPEEVKPWWKSLIHLLFKFFKKEACKK